MRNLMLILFTLCFFITVVNGVVLFFEPENLKSIMGFLLFAALSVVLMYTSEKMAGHARPLKTMMSKTILGIVFGLSTALALMFLFAGKSLFFMLMCLGMVLFVGGLFKGLYGGKTDGA